MKPIGRDTPPRAQNRSAGQQARLNKTESKTAASRSKRLAAVLARPAGFEPTAYRLGVPKSVRLWHPSTPLERLILLDF